MPRKHKGAPYYRCIGSGSVVVDVVVLGRLFIGVDVFCRSQRHGPGTRRVRQDYGVEGPDGVPQPGEGEAHHRVGNRQPKGAGVVEGECDFFALQSYPAPSQRARQR